MTRRGFPASEDGRLGAAERAAYARDGYLLLEGFVSSAECVRLMARAAEIVAAFTPDEATVFSTTDHRHAAERYFLESGDKVRCFLEEEAVDGEGRLVLDKRRAVNKIGHALHDLDSVFSSFSRAPRLAALAESLGYSEPLLLQSMYIFKQPGIGGEVSCHQDASFLYSEPLSVTGLWFALEEASLENGCLEVLPGGHLAGLGRRFRRGPDGRFDFEAVGQAPSDEDPSASTALLPLEVPRGSLVVLNGLLPHRSRANRSLRSRQAYTLHLLEAAAHYPSDNWLQREGRLPLRGFR